MNQIDIYSYDELKILWRAEDNVAVLHEFGASNIYLHSVSYLYAMSMQENKNLIPSVLTLALNDAITYDKVS